MIGVYSSVCRLCGPSDFRCFLEKDGYHLGRCTKCGLLQVTDDLGALDLTEVYDQEFFDETYCSIQTNKSSREKEYEKCDLRLQEIETLLPGRGSILDIGCSFGFFLDVARQRGWKVAGVEVGEYAARVAREDLGLEVFDEALDEVDLPQGHFDVVTLWNVIEHLKDPVGDLRRVNNSMREGGLLVFTTGDVDSYLRRLQGSLWRSFIPPVHLVNFSVKTVVRLLEASGFAVARVTVALPREPLLKRLGLLELLRRLKFSDKMMVFARKQIIPGSKT